MTRNKPQNKTKKNMHVTLPYRSGAMGWQGLWSHWARTPISFLVPCSDCSGENANLFVGWAHIPTIPMVLVHFVHAYFSGSGEKGKHQTRWSSLFFFSPSFIFFGTWQFYRRGRSRTTYMYLVTERRIHLCDSPNKAGPSWKIKMSIYLVLAAYYLTSDSMSRWDQLCNSV